APRQRIGQVAQLLTRVLLGVGGSVQYRDDYAAGLLLAPKKRGEGAEVKERVLELDHQSIQLQPLDLRLQALKGVALALAPAADDFGAIVEGAVVSLGRQDCGLRREAGYQVAGVSGHAAAGVPGGDPASAPHRQH